MFSKYEKYLPYLVVAVLAVAIIWYFRQPEKTTTAPKAREVDAPAPATDAKQPCSCTDHTAQPPPRTAAPGATTTTPVVVPVTAVSSTGAVTTEFRQLSA